MAKSTKRIRQVKQTSSGTVSSSILSNKKRVRIPKNRKLTEILEIPDRGSINGEPKGQQVRRWRTEEELLRACLSEGMRRSDIKRLFNVTDKEISTIEKRLLANEGQLFVNQSTAHRYYTYTLQQEQCARDLEFILSMIVEEMVTWNEAFKISIGQDDPPPLPPKPSSQAAVMAVKAKSDILDRTIKMGQDLGLIEKRAKELRVSGGLNLAAIPTEELRIVLQKKLNEFEKLVGRGKLPTVYQQMIANRKAPHERATKRGGDGSNLDPIFD